MGGWWVRNTANKAQLRPAVAGALPELGNKLGLNCASSVRRVRDVPMLWQHGQIAPPAAGSILLGANNVYIIVFEMNKNDYNCQTPG